MVWLASSWAGLSALDRFCGRFPRALPWAGIGRAVGARAGGGEFSDEGGEEVGGGGAGGGELRFQRVHQGHQLLHFGYDQALFGEGWKPVPEGQRPGPCQPGATPQVTT